MPTDKQLSVPLGGYSPETYLQDKREALEYLEKNGWDMNSLVEIPVVWGHQDAMQHVNNVTYVRYFETGRVRFMDVLGQRNGESTGDDFILASINVRYRRPVVFPDTLIVATRPLNIGKDRFDIESICYSFAQKTIAAISGAKMVTYDYKALKAKPMSDIMADNLRKLLNQKAHL